MLSIIMDVERIAGAEAAEREVAAFLKWVKSARPQVPGTEILLPGEPERRARAHRSAHGIPIDSTTWAAITDAAKSVGVTQIPA
jgi:uncharacterized oxidoreductase